jgi:exosortase D (VPLPA-CTERM-specific)
VLRELSNSLQLISSQMGVWLIRLFDISVYLEGNVIDLGSYKLQVVEACSGLRYLFPLIVLGILSAYFFRASMWKRAVVVLSTIPLTIVINSLRIGLIGVTVEHWGPKMAEGLLHDFEGWFMFMVCIALLIGEMAVLARIGGRGESLRSAFGLEAPQPIPQGARIGLRQAAAPLLTAGVLMASVGAYALWKPAQEPMAPARTAFSEFPLELKGGWRGKPEALATDVLAILAVKDYFMANFVRPGEPAINFYSAYYASQGGGESSHSPRTCLPGGGWAMSEIAERQVALGGNLGSVPVNRAIIQQGESRQLVYYWFRQRGRQLTDEMAVKWYILADGVTRNRSDGALLRLVTPLGRTEDVATADGRLTEFMSQIQPRLAEFVPD